MAKKFKCNVCQLTFDADAMPDKCPFCGAPASECEALESADGQPKKKKLDVNSNLYTVCYAAVMVIVVAFLLAFVSSALRQTQEANVANDTKGQILTALRYDREKIDVAQTFEQKVKDMLWKDGKLVPYQGSFLTAYGEAIKKGELHVFVAQTTEGEKYVVPVTGRGLWGGLWGYVALNADRQSVYGAYFYHESETAGLGARIAEPDFQELFRDKKVFAQDGRQVALTVVKAGNVKDEAHEVNGITGATLTSVGVADMMRDGLSAYVSFMRSAELQDTLSNNNQ